MRRVPDPLRRWLFAWGMCGLSASLAHAAGEHPAASQPAPPRTNGSLPAEAKAGKAAAAPYPAATAEPADPGSAGAGLAPQEPSAATPEVETTPASNPLATTRAQVALVKTEGSHAWLAAERRLIAELGAMGVKVLILPGRNASDPALRERAQLQGARVALQVLRQGNDGVIRFWSQGGDSPKGEFRHISVNLRNPDVVSLAVLPVADFVFLRTVEIPGPSAPERGSSARGPRPVDGAFLPWRLRSEMHYAARAGAGPWFSGADTTPAVNLVLGVRAHWFRLFACEAEAFGQAIAHKVNVANGVGELNLLGARAHFLYEPWPTSDVSFGIGPGLGYLWRVYHAPGESRQLDSAPVASLRAQLASALLPSIDVVFAFTVSDALTPIYSRSIEHPTGSMLRTGLDSMIGIDWHWQ